MKAKKHLNLSIPLWWPSGPGWRRLACWLLPSPGNALFTLLVVAGLLWATSAGALPFRAPMLAGDSTTTISYQGRLADSSGDPITTSGVGMQFRLYNTDTGGSSLWEEPHTAVPVEDGLFHVLLGSTNPIPVSLLANNSTLWLGITVGSDSEMTPREQIASVPYAMIASTVADGAVTTEKIADEAVTQAKLGADVSLVPPDGSITTTMIADGAVTPPKAPALIQSLSGTNLKIQSGLRTSTGGTTSYWIAFPTPFASSPTVVAVADYVIPVQLAVRDISTTGFRVDKSVGEATVNWIAIGQ